MTKSDQETAGQTGAAAPQPPRSVLHRKAQVGVEEHRAKSMSLAKALRLSIARVADETLDMAMAALGVRVQTCAADDLSDALDADGLLMLLDGPQRRRGAAIIDANLVGALIQQQTIGRVLPDASGDPRRLTSTDAAICAPFLDALMHRAASMPEMPLDREVLQGFCFGVHVAELRLLMLSLSKPDYHLFTLSIDIAGGARQGQIILCVPVVEEPALPVDHDTDAGGEAIQRPQRTLEQTVMQLNVALGVSLARISMPLKNLRKLRVDTLVDIGSPDFGAIRVQSSAGRTLAQGRLGQIDGQRAVEIAHRAAKPTSPKRRAEDRVPADLEQHGPGAKATMQASTLMENTELPNLPQPVVASDLPDMSDLPDLPELDDLPEFDAAKAG